MRPARSRMGPRLLTTATVVWALVLLLPFPGTSSGAAPAAPPTAAVGADAIGLPGVPVSFALGSSAFNLSSTFWGSTITPRASLFPGLGSLVAATPARVMVWPGAAAGDQYDPIPPGLNISISPVNGTVVVQGNLSGTTLLHQVGPSTVVAATSEAEFVQWCRTINCSAILQVPGEVNNTTLAQQIVYYTERILNFTPVAWEVGNEPELWKLANCPWVDWNTPACYRYNHRVHHDRITIRPLQYAYEVQNYTIAMRAIDPHIQVLGVPATGRPENRLTLTDWVNATVRVNALNPNGTPNDNLGGVAMHIYPGGKFGPAVLAQFYGTLASPAGLPARVESVRDAVLNATSTVCGTRACRLAPVYVTEVGAALSHYNDSQFARGFPGALDLAAQAMQAMTLNVTTLDLYATLLNTSNSWFPPSTDVPRPDYTLYSELLPRLGKVVFPVQLTPPDLPIYYAHGPASDTSLHANLYGVATVSPARGARADLLVANLNLSTSVRFTPLLPGVGGGASVEVWYWNGTLATVNGNLSAIPVTEEPVAQYLPLGLPADFTLPAQSLALFEAYPAPSGVPVTFRESGLPPATRWFVDVDGQLRTSNQSGDITAFVAPGTYPAASLSIPLPVGGTEKLARERLEPFLTSSVRVGSSPMVCDVSFATQWAVNVTAVPYNAGTVTAVGSWANASAPLQLSGNPAPGFAFVRWSGYGDGSYNGTANPTTIDPTGPVNEKALFAPAFQVTFTRSNLPNGTSWGVTVKDSTYESSATQLSFYETDGVYGFVVADVAGYRAAPAAGSFHVSGSAVLEAITFESLRSPPSTYSVTLRESTLRAGTPWSVTVRGMTYESSGPTIGLSEANGTYGYQVGPVPGYRAVPANSSFSVNGADLGVAVGFVALTPPGLAQFGVVWQETGLGPHPAWAVVVNGAAMAVNGASLWRPFPNGSYSFVVPGVPGFEATARSGWANVTGSPLAIPVTFEPFVFEVRFLVSGGPAGVPWEVRVSNTTLSVEGSATQLHEPNGSYAFDVIVADGYHAVPSHGRVTVLASDAAVAITLVASHSPAAPPLWSLLGRAVSVAFVLAVSALGSASAVRAVRLRRPKTPS